MPNHRDCFEQRVIERTSCIPHQTECVKTGLTHFAHCADYIAHYEVAQLEAEQRSWLHVRLRGRISDESRRDVLRIPRPPPAIFWTLR